MDYYWEHILKKRRIHAIKMDADQTELEVFHGMSCIFKESPPHLFIFEWSVFEEKITDPNRDLVTHLLRPLHNLNYDMFYYEGWGSDKTTSVKLNSPEWTIEEAKKWNDVKYGYILYELKSNGER